MKIFGLPIGKALGTTATTTYALWQGRRVLNWAQRNQKTALLIGVTAAYVLHRFIIWLRSSERAAGSIKLSTSGLKVTGGIPSEAHEAIRKIDADLNTIERQLLRLSGSSKPGTPPIRRTSMVSLEFQDEETAIAHLDDQILRAQKLQGPITELSPQSAVAPKAMRAAALSIDFQAGATGVHFTFAKGQFAKLNAKLREAQSLVNGLKTQMRKIKKDS